VKDEIDMYIYARVFQENAVFLYFFFTRSQRETLEIYEQPCMCCFLLSAYGLWKWGRKLLQVSIYTPFRRRRRKVEEELLIKQQSKVGIGDPLCDFIFFPFFIGQT
jgi:hypothetical protein